MVEGRSRNAEHFIGRADELDRLELACAAARHGHGRLVTVVGRAGIGKTRLCEEASARARHAGLTTAWGRCWLDGGAPPLWPWQAILAELCGSDAARLLDGDAGLERVDPERFSRFVAVGDRLAAACARSPTFLVIDDLHAADPGAMLLTRYVARALHRLSLVLVVTRRDPEPAFDPAAARLLDDMDHDATPIALTHFGLDETHEFMAAYGVENVEPELAMAALRVTGGNPLFLRRLIALGVPGRDRTLPDGLRAALDRALTRLEPETQRILEATAVLGTAPALTEAVAVAGTNRAEVLDAVAEAVEAGMVTDVGPTSFRFSHDLVREVLVARLSPAARVDAHASAAAAIGAHRDIAASDRVARWAYHATLAASRSQSDALLAVTACRVAARHLRRRFAYEQSVSFLSTAAELVERAGDDVELAWVLVEWAQSVLECGRLTEARAIFERATAAAERVGAPVLFAEAAIGLGGVWVNEHRTPIERERVLGLQREARARLPAGEASLRCRLDVRLAAEAVYGGAPVATVQAALRATREHGDARALAEALSLCHHALLTCEHPAARLPIADELISVASAAGEGVLALMGLCWRTVDLFQLGDARAKRALADLRARADALGCRAILAVVAALDVMLLIRSGQLEEAETKANECYELGTEVGDADALAYYGAHLVIIRWLQGRAEEVVDLVEQVADSPTLAEGEFTFRAAAASLAATTGQLDRARAALSRLTVDGLGALPRSSTWLAGMLAIVEAAAAIDDADVAREAYDLLRPHADLPVMPSVAVVCFGSAERPLGLAAMTFRDLDAAVEHLERAVTANVRLRNRPFAALCRADLAEALRRRSAPGDRRRASGLLADAARDAAAMGMARRAHDWDAARRRLDDGRDRSGSRPAVIRREGSQWRVAIGGRHAVVADRVGMVYLAQLVAQPGVAIPALALAAGAQGEIPEPATHALLDPQARAAYARRARELAGDLAEARANADLARTERLEHEVDALTTELERATGLGGRARTFSGPSERARTAVRKAIKRALGEIAAADPEIGNGLRAAVTTGYVCRYAPDQASEVA